jgi:hypothetical protein
LDRKSATCAACGRFEIAFAPSTLLFAVFIFAACIGSLRTVEL